MTGQLIPRWHWHCRPRPLTINAKVNCTRIPSISHSICIAFPTRANRSQTLMVYRKVWYNARAKSIQQIKGFCVLSKICSLFWKLVWLVVFASLKSIFWPSEFDTTTCPTRGKWLTKQASKQTYAISITLSNFWTKN